MQIFRFREQVMNLLESISGNRVNYSMNRIGGVNRDVRNPEAIRDCVRAIYAIVLEKLIPICTTDRSILRRCTKVGVLTMQDALAYGAVGPVARASGVDTDMRRDRPYLVYGELQFKVPVRSEGDVLARVVVRAREMLESCKIIEQALDNIPDGPLHAGNIYSVPAGEAVVRVEAPRGEVFYFVASDGSDTPLRVKVRTPSFANIPTVVPMVTGNELADVPLVQAAIDPCYSCTDR